MNVLQQALFFTIGKKTETKKLRILKKLRVIPAKKLRLLEALCNVPGPKNWYYRRPYLVSSAQKNSEYEKNSKLSTKNSACRRVGPTRSSKKLVKKSLDYERLLLPQVPQCRFLRFDLGWEIWGRPVFSPEGLWLLLHDAVSWSAEKSCLGKGKI